MSSPSFLTPLRTLADASLQFVQSPPANDADEQARLLKEWEQVLHDTLDALQADPLLKKLSSRLGIDTSLTAYLLMIALPSLDANYLSYWADFYEQDQKLPTAAQVTTMLTTTQAQRSELLATISNEHPLYYWGLIVTQPNPKNEDEPLLSVSQVLIDFLLGHTSYAGSDIADPLLENPLPLASDTQLGFGAENRIMAVQKGIPLRQKAIAFTGARLNDQGLAVLHADVLSASAQGEDLFRRILLILALENVALYWQEGSKQLKKEPQWLPMVNRWLELPNTRLWIGQTKPLPIPDALQSKSKGMIAVAPFTPKQAAEVWHAYGTSHLPNSSIDWASLANTYTFVEPRIRETISLLKTWQQEGTTLNTDTFRQAFVRNAPTTLGAGTQQMINPKVTVSGLVFDETVKEVINTVVTLWQHQRMTLAHKGNSMHSFSVLLAGPQHDEKLTVALAITNTTGLPLYAVEFTTLDATDEATLAPLLTQAQEENAALMVEDIQRLVQVADKGDKTAVAQLDSLFKASAHYGVPVLFTLPEGGTLPKSLKNSVEVITLPPLTPDQHALQLKQFVTEQDIAMEQKHLNTLIGLLNQTDSAKIKAMTQTAAALAAKDQQAIDGKLQVTSEHLNEALAYHANP